MRAKRPFTGAKFLCDSALREAKTCASEERVSARIHYSSFGSDLFKASALRLMSVNDLKPLRSSSFALLRGT